MQENYEIFKDLIQNVGLLYYYVLLLVLEILKKQKKKALKMNKRKSSEKKREKKTPLKMTSQAFFSSLGPKSEKNFL